MLHECDGRKESKTDRMSADARFCVLSGIGLRLSHCAALRRELTVGAAGITEVDLYLRSFSVVNCQTSAYGVTRVSPFDSDQIVFRLTDSMLSFVVRKTSRPNGVRALADFIVCVFCCVNFSSAAAFGECVSIFI